MAIGGFRALLIAPAVAAAALGAPWDPEHLAGIEPRRYTAFRASGAVVVDGSLDEPSWQHAPWTQLFVDIEGDLKAAPRLQTRARMLWDDEHFYVAAFLEEPHVWATLTQRDAVIFHDNDFEVFVDPDWDTHNYYEYEVNAFGTEWDLLLVRPYRDGGPPVHAWDIPGLRTGVRVYGTINDPGDEDEGWSVEIAFPWEGLRRPSRTAVPPEDGHIWRINFSRVQWRVVAAEDGQGYVKVPGEREDNWVWSPQGLINMHFPEQWGYVRFAHEVVGPGAAGGDFELPPEDAAIRLLREIYWRQRVRARKGLAYAAVPESLGLAPRTMDGFHWPPGIAAAEHGYEAWVEEAADLHGDGAINRWLLTEDSRVRKVKRPEPPPPAAPAAP